MQQILRNYNKHENTKEGKRAGLSVIVEFSKSPQCVHYERRTSKRTTVRSNRCNNEHRKDYQRGKTAGSELTVQREQWREISTSFVVPILVFPLPSVSYQLLNNPLCDNFSDQLQYDFKQNLFETSDRGRFMYYVSHTYSPKQLDSSASFKKCECNSGTLKKIYMKMPAGSGSDHLHARRIPARRTFKRVTR